MLKNVNMIKFNCYKVEFDVTTFVFAGVHWKQKQLL